MPHAAFDKQPANHMDSEPANCTPAGMLAADPANQQTCTFKTQGQSSHKKRCQPQAEQLIVYNLIHATHLRG